MVLFTTTVYSQTIETLVLASVSQMGNMHSAHIHQIGNSNSAAVTQSQ
jgi:hypothetical protein